MRILAQIVGIIALTCAVISFQQNAHRRILVFQLISGVIFVIHFLMLNAYTGAILNLVAVMRSVVFVNKGKSWADNKIWLVIFCLLSVAVGFFTWNGFATLLPIGGMICTTVAFWVKSPKRVRLIAFPSSPLWLVYNVLNNSFAGIITEIINMCSIIVAMFRFDYKKVNK